jgi:hypothetical protein
MKDTNKQIKSTLNILGKHFWEFSQNIFYKSWTIYCDLKRCDIIQLCKYMFKEFQPKYVMFK